MDKTKKILIVTSRNPFDETSTDGGSMTVANLWDSLKDIADVDFLISDSICVINPEGTSCIHTYTIPDELEFPQWGAQRFLDRIKVSRFVAERIRELSPQYDKIIIQHVFHAFGLCSPGDDLILRKTILFPMLLTPSYQLCNEIVPSDYTELEQEVLQCVGKIITPSQFEKDQLIGYYGIASWKVTIIPRYVSDVFTVTRYRTVGPSLDICYVASIKNQKRNDLALELLASLNEKGMNARLFMVGSVFDKQLFEKMKSFIAEQNMERDVVFCHSLSQKELDELFSKMFLSVSVARCETFGRAVIEGLYTGLPAVVLKGVTCFDMLIGEGNGIEYGNSIEEMASIIMRLYNDEDDYLRLSHSASLFGHRFSKESIQPRLREELCG